MLQVTSSSVEGFKFFFVTSMLILNLSVVSTFWPISSRSRLVHGCIHGPCIKSHGSWLIVDGSLSTEFLQGLAH